MKDRAARRLLACYLENPFGDTPPVFEKALKTIAASPELSADYEKQARLDRRAAALLESVEVPEEAVRVFAEKIQSASESMLSPRNPAMVSVALGFLLLVALLVWNFLGRPAAFPPDAVEIAGSAMKFDGEVFEDAGVPAGELVDWFVLRGFDGFFVPIGLDSVETEGATIAKIDNQPVALVDAANGKARFVVFDRDRLGVEIAPGEWRVADVGGGRSAAIREQDGMCFMVLMKGSPQDVSDFARRGGR